MVLGRQVVYGKGRFDIGEAEMLREEAWISKSIRSGDVGIRIDIKM